MRVATASSSDGTRLQLKRERVPLKPPGNRRSGSCSGANTGDPLMRESSQSLHDNVNTYFITIPGIARPVSRVALGTWAIGGWSVGRDRRARRHRDDPGRPLPGHQPDRYRAVAGLRSSAVTRCRDSTRDGLHPELNNHRSCRPGIHGAPAAVLGRSDRGDSLALGSCSSRNGPDAGVLGDSMQNR